MDIVNIIYVILFLVLIYFYQQYKYRSIEIENFNNNEDKVIKPELKDILHDSFFLNSDKGITMGGIIRDNGNIHSFEYHDIFIKKPDNLDEVIQLVKDANENKKNLRIRGGGTSFSGISIPKENEVFVDMRNLNHYHFDQVGTIIVDSGIGLNDLKRFLDNEGFKLPVYPTNLGLLDSITPTIGGFISKGGISPESKEFGGLWENILEITIIDGYGQKKIVNMNDELFPWLFGGYGQFGIIVSAKLKIKHIDKNKDFYPLGKKGIIEQFKYKIRDQKYFCYHIFCDKERVEESEKNIRTLISSQFKSDKNKKDFKLNTFFVKFHKNNPPLLYRNRSFYCVQGVQYLDDKDEEYKKKIKIIENNFMKLMEDNALYRYPQIEYLDTTTLRDYYMNRRVYDKFLIHKNRLDPNGIFNHIDNFSKL